MSYLGQAPSEAVLTGSQLPDGIITTPKLATNAVTDVKVNTTTLLDRAVNATANIALTKLADGANITKNNANNTWGAAQAGATEPLSETGSFTFNFDADQNFIVTFGGNLTFANPTTENVGQSGIIVCIQDGTGSRTLSLGTDYETVGGTGITLSTAAGAIDILPYFIKATDSIQLGAPQLAFS